MPEYNPLADRAEAERRDALIQEALDEADLRHQQELRAFMERAIWRPLRSCIPIVGRPVKRRPMATRRHAA